MYYKVENTGSKLFIELFEMRRKEIQMQKDNEQAIKDKFGSDFNEFVGDYGQQNVKRVTIYDAFVFHNPDKLNSKSWKPHSKFPKALEPNRRTKYGKEAYKFIKGLPGNMFWNVYDIIGIEVPTGKHTFPFIDAYSDVILLYLGDLEIDLPNIIEITKKEFDGIRDRKSEESIIDVDN